MVLVKDRQGNLVQQGKKQDNLLKILYGTSLGRCALKFLICKPVSDLAGLYMSSRMSTVHIASFIKNNHIDMSQYVDKKYKSYNDFFTRRIKPGQRPIEQDDEILMAPADSKVSYYQIRKDSCFTIKDTPYSLSDLLQDEKLAKEYENGICLVFRLAVDDYHRYSYVDDGVIKARKHIKGVFHTVNPIANDYYPIYKTNSREYSIIESKNFGKMIQMEVGAMMVGKIVNYHHHLATKGHEKGYFKFGGSTVVLIFKENQVVIDQDIVDHSKDMIETKVRLGESIGHKMGVHENV